MGVPVGGPFDRRSADLANALAGNGPECGVLELTLRGGTFESLGSLGIALAGAPMEASIVGTDHRPRSLPIPVSTTMRAGERLVLGRTLAGARTYLAVRGGLRTAVRLGSRSTEQPLRRGDFLRTGESRIATRRPGEADSNADIQAPIRIIDGPDARTLGVPAVLEKLTFRVGSRSNRMGLRLEGPPLAVNAEPDRLSAPVAPGAVQAAGGQLIILGVAGGTMGGYPDVAHVISADLDRIGQLRPGDPLTFRRVGVAEARDLDRASRQVHRALLLRLKAWRETAPGPQNGQIKLDRAPVPEVALARSAAMGYTTAHHVTSSFATPFPPGTWVRRRGLESKGRPMRMIAGRGHRRGAALRRRFDRVARLPPVSLPRLDGPPPAAPRRAGRHGLRQVRRPLPWARPRQLEALTRVLSRRRHRHGDGTRRRIDPDFPALPDPDRCDYPRVGTPHRCLTNRTDARSDQEIGRDGCPGDAQPGRDADRRSGCEDREFGDGSRPEPGVLRGRPGLESDSRGPSVSVSVRDPEDPGRQERDHGPR